MSMPLFLQITRAGRTLERQIAPLITPSGISVTGLFVLCELLRLCPQSPTQLARAVGDQPTAFTAILDRLEDGGWVQRIDSPDNNRDVRVHLTPKAEEQRAHFLATAEAIEKAIRESGSGVFWSAFAQTMPGINLTDTVEPLKVR